MLLDKIPPARRIDIDKLQVAIIVTFVLGALSVLLIKSKTYGLASIGLAMIATLMGGSKVEAATHEPRAFSAGLDYFVLWHHTSDEEGIDKNFAVFLSFIDVIFRTAHMPPYWPKKYGTVKFQPPESWVGQFVYPFKRKKDTPYG
jgi:sterol desaturase/sphingolipid hydroxylase (fatty acid hydroxylase superfamily)